MIRKYQQGGSQQDALVQFIKGIAQALKADPQQVVQIAQQNPEALQQAAQVYQQTQDMNQAAQTFVQAAQKKARKAEHGAKLNYIKNLKNQCADDEEVYYYAKGGNLGCGCKKKMEDGGKTPKEKQSAIEEFKNRKVKKDCYGSKFKMKKGDKVKSARGGSCVAEFKRKFQQGGFLK